MKIGKVVIALAVGGSLVLTGCSSPGGSEGEGDPASESSAAGDPTAEAPTGVVLPVTAEAIADMGPTTLSVWADGGEELTMAQLIPQFEAMYPNITVDLTLKGFDDLMSTVVPALSGDSAPDVAQGNQGYAVDGTLVGADLIRPLDDVATAYGWANSYNVSDYGQFSWAPDGSSFGSGTLYGMSPVTEFVGVFYNKSKLADLGLEAPQTFEEFEAALAAAKSAGELPIMMGNSDKYPATHVYGVIQGAFTPAQNTRDWIGGSAGSTFNDPTNEQALNSMKQWADEGYFPKGFNGISADDATAQFGSGDGVFLIGGTWNAGAINKTLGADAGFISAPSGSSGASAGTGSLGLGWHVSSKTDAEPAAIAFVAMIMDSANAQVFADLNRIPASNGTVSSSNALFEEQIRGAARTLADSGQTYYFDWATETMYDVFTASLQEFLDGRISAADFMSVVQTDWDTFLANR